jgi:hypothetical protein
MKYLLVVLGGGVGSLSRYLIGSALVTRYGTRLPVVGTMTINITGSFLIGTPDDVDHRAIRREFQSPPTAGNRLSRRVHDIFQFRVGDLLGDSRRRLLDRNL